MRSIIRFGRPAMISMLVLAAACLPTRGMNVSYLTGKPDAVAVKQFAVGDQVDCNSQALGKLYPGVITSLKNDMLHVTYDDATREEMTPSLCTKRVGEPSDAIEPGTGDVAPGSSGAGAGEPCKRDLECGGDLVCEQGTCSAG